MCTKYLIYTGMPTSVLSSLFQFIFYLKLSGFGNVLIHFAEDTSVSESLANYVASVLKLGWLNLSNLTKFSLSKSGKKQTPQDWFNLCHHIGERFAAVQADCQQTVSQR